MWGDVLKFITECGDLAPKCREKLATLLSSKSEELRVELTIRIDVGEDLVKSTYTPEGDGILALKCYDTINTVKAALEVTALAKHQGNHTFIYCCITKPVDGIRKPLPKHAPLHAYTKTMQKPHMHLTLNALWSAVHATRPVTY